MFVDLDDTKADPVQGPEDWWNDPEFGWGGRCRSHRS
jgi:hypothetical protein